MDPIPLPAPFGGVNESLPPIAVESPNCTTLFNFNTVAGGIALRNGDGKYNKWAKQGALSTALHLVNYGDVSQFLVTDRSVAGVGIDIYDVSSPGVAVYSYGGANTYNPYSSLYFNGTLYICSSISNSYNVRYDGTTWTAGLGYTYSGITPFGGCVFKNRAYFLGRGYTTPGVPGTPIYCYSGIDSTSGALTNVDLSSIVRKKTSIAGIGTITLADNVSAEIFLAIVLYSGEILFFSGPYPDSADWRLTARAETAPILCNGPLIPYQGDTLVITDIGIVSLRDLFLKGSGRAASLSLSDNVQNSYQALVQAIRTNSGFYSGPIILGIGGSIAIEGNIRGIWDPVHERIIISFPFYLDSNSTLQPGSFYFIYDTHRQAWTMHRSFATSTGTWGGSNQFRGIIDISFFQNNVRIVANNATNYMVWNKEGSVSFVDRNIDDNAQVGYDFRLVSAPISDGRAYVQQAEGMDVIFKCDLNSDVYYSMQRDFGLSTTNTQLSNASNSTSYQKPFINVGIEGSYIQYIFSGNSDTTASGFAARTGLQVFGVNFWKSSGNSPR